MKFSLFSFSGISTSFEGKHGSIRYWVKAEIDKPWSFNHKTKKAFTVISPIDINRPEYMVSFYINCLRYVMEYIIVVIIKPCIFDS